MLIAPPLLAFIHDTVTVPFSRRRDVAPGLKIILSVQEVERGEDDAIDVDMEQAELVVNEPKV